MQTQQIYAKLDSLYMEMYTTKYVADTIALSDMEEEQKEQFFAAIVRSWLGTLRQTFWVNKIR